MFCPSWHRWLILGVLVLIMAAVTKNHVASWNDASRMAVVESIVERGTLIIDRSSFVGTGDKVFFRGHFYSDKPPMLSVIGAAMYWFLHQCGISLSGSAGKGYYWITLLTIGLGWLLCVCCFYLALSLVQIKEKYRILLTLSLGLGTIFFPWSTVFNNHSIAASLLFVGFYFLLQARFSGGGKHRLFFSGLFFSLAGVIDVPSALFYAGFIIYIVFEKSLRKDISYFCLPLLVTALPAVVLNFLITGDFIPAEIHRQAWIYPGSPWIWGAGLSGFELNRGSFLAEYSFNALIGSRGFFLYDPLFLLSGYCLWVEIYCKKRFYKEAIVVGAVSIVIMLYYLLTTSNYGGWSYGVRWLVSLIPITAFFLYNFFERMKSFKRIVFSVFLLISVAVSSVGLINPWARCAGGEGPIMNNLQDFFILSSVK